MRLALRLALFCTLLLAGGGANAATYVVESAADTCEVPPLCLRRAIALANANADTDTIVFSIPGDPAQPRHIILGGPLVVTQPIVIDGYTQPGASVNTLDEGTNAQIRIVVSATGAGPGASALTVTAGPSTIRGLALVGADDAGLLLHTNGHEVTLHGSFIGVMPDGVTTLSNRWGVKAYTGFNAIGGVNPADRNLISGNRWSGVLLSGATAIRNAVLGNLIGTNRHAAPVLGNGWAGVQLTSAQLSRIGGYSHAAQNLIAGNRDGVTMHGNDVQNLEVVSRIHGNQPSPGAIWNNCATGNDPGDVDTGPNECLNHPIVDSARVVGGEMVIEGTFDSLPNRPARIALYGNTVSCLWTQTGETGHYLGTVTVTTDAGGHAPFRLVVPAGPSFTSVAAIAGVGQEDVFVDATSHVGPCRAVSYPDRVFADAFER